MQNPLPNRPMENTQKSRKATHHTWLLIHIRGGRKRRVWNLKPRHLSFHVKTNANGLCHKNPIRVSKLPSHHLPNLWPFSVLFVCLLVWSVDLPVIKPVLVVKKTEDKEWANLISAFLVGVLWKVNVWWMRAEVIDYPIRSALSKPYHDGVQAILWCSLILQFK